GGSYGFGKGRCQAQRYSCQPLTSPRRTGFSRTYKSFAFVSSADRNTRSNDSSCHIAPWCSSRWLILRAEAPLIAFMISNSGITLCRKPINSWGENQVGVVGHDYSGVQVISKGVIVTNRFKDDVAPIPAGSVDLW